MKPRIRSGSGGMSRLLRLPLLLPASLFVLWLLLADSLSPGQMVLGVLFSALVSAAVAALRPLRGRPRSLRAVFKLIGCVLIDILRSNVGVARVILSATRQQPVVGFVDIPLEMRDPHGLAMLALIITGTPGTVWAGHDLERNVLTLHVLDLHDHEFWRQTVKSRYERPLMEIFECKQS